MPRAKHNSGGNTPLPQFVSCPLTEDELEHCRKAPLDDGHIVDFIVKVVENGCKLSFGWDAWNECVTCTQTRANADKSKAGIALTSRGPDFHGAITVAAYKFYVKLDGDMGAASPEITKNQWG